MTRSLPIVAILSFVLGLLAITALQAVARGDTPPVAPAPLVNDAGVALPSPAGTPAVTLPAAPAKPHDMIDDPTQHPTAYISDVDAARKSGGLWLAILVGLYGLGLGVVRLVPSLAPREGERTRRVAIAAGAMTTLGATVDATAGGGSMLAVLVALLGAVMLAIDPHTPSPGGIGTSPTKP